MSAIIANKIQSGISATPAHNFILDASAADGTFVLKRADGSTILTVSAAGVVDIQGSGMPYGLDNILGSVSQSGGVPTGALMEYGWNANGSYFKYTDGLLINLVKFSTTDSTPTLDGSIYYSAAKLWTFPHAFISEPLFFGSVVLASHISWVANTSPSFWAINMYACSPSISGGGYLRGMTVGRWF